MDKTLKELALIIPILVIIAMGILNFKYKRTIQKLNAKIELYMDTLIMINVDPTVSVEDQLEIEKLHEENRNLYHLLTVSKDRFRKDSIRMTQKIRRIDEYAYKKIKHLRQNPHLITDPLLDSLARNITRHGNPKN